MSDSYKSSVSEDNEQFDVIVIGAGISGLTAGALLSKAGLKVVILEKHYVIGGYLQGFERNGFIFDTAIHWLNQCGEKGTVTKVFNYIDPNYPKPQSMKVINRHYSNILDYKLSNNPEELRQKLIQDFPHEEKGLNNFFNAAKNIAKISLKFPQLFRSTETMGFIEKTLYNIRKISIGFPLVKYVFYSGEEGMKKGLGKFFQDPKLMSLWSTEKDLLSCLFPIAWAYNNDYQNPPIGGSQAFPNWLENVINKTNSCIKLSSPVTEIIVENNQFIGVKYSNRGKTYTLNAKHLIAACDTSMLYEKLLKKHFEGHKIIEKLNKSELYSSSVTISLALNKPCEDLGFSSELTLICNDKNTLRAEHSSGDPKKVAISVLSPTVRDKSMCPENKGVLTLYVPAYIDYDNNWKTTKNEKGEFVRNDEYKQLKQDFANIIIERVAEKMCPNLKEHIEFMEIATPITYHRYSWNKNGTMMGTRPGKINMQLKVAHYKTEIKNITIGGHWAELGGGVPIAVKAAYNSSLIVLKDLKPLEYKKLVNVMEL